MQRNSEAKPRQGRAEPGVDSVARAKRGLGYAFQGEACLGSGGKAALCHGIA